MIIFKRDQIIIEEYVLYDVPADRIPSDPEKSVEFLRRVNSRLPEDDHFSQADLNRRLLNLRRKGQDKGGLPRIRRN